MSVAAEADGQLPAKWINSLWPDIPEGEWLSLFAMTPDGKDRQTLWAQTTAQAAALIHRHAATHNVWLGCATRTRNLGALRGSAADCGHIPGLWLDVDIQGPHHTRQDLPPDVETALTIIDGFPVAPTVIVHSGNGLQPWWLFDEPAATADHAPLVEAWAHTWTKRFTDAGYGLDNVFDIARILRVAGTLNHKNTPPAPVTVHTINRNSRYGIDDIDQWLETPPPPPTPAPTRLVPYIGPTRPGDAFNAAHNGADILNQAGWTHARTDHNGDLHYRHPTATSPTSATVYADDGHTTIWTDSYPNLEPRRPYDPFGLYTALHHQGDWRQATRHLAAHGYGAQPVTAADLIDATPPTPTHPDPTAPERQGPEDLAAWWDNNQPAPTPDLLQRPDGVHLLYLQQLNWIHGESGSGKTWVILIAAAQHITNGGTCLWVHYEDPTPRPIISRLKLLGIPRHTAINHFHYWNPQGEPLDPHLILEYAEQHDIDLVIIDSVGEALNASGLDENLDKDVGPWITHGPRTIVNAGIAVVCIDHGTKAAEKPLYPSGSKRKRAAVTGAAYLIEAVTAPTATTEGLLRVTCAKDRHGTHRQGDVVGLVRIAPNIVTGGVTAIVNTPAGAGGTDDEDSRRVREVVRIIDANPGLSKNQLIALMATTRKQKKQEAIDTAIDSGLVDARIGSRNAVLIYPKSEEN